MSQKFVFDCLVPVSATVFCFTFLVAFKNPFTSADEGISADSNG